MHTTKTSQSVYKTETLHTGRNQKPPVLRYINIIVVSSNATGEGKFHDFRPLHRHISKMLRHRATVNIINQLEVTHRLSIGTKIHNLALCSCQTCSQVNLYRAKNTTGK